MASSTSGASREPSPNRGRGIEDYIVDGDNVLDQDGFRKEFDIDKSKQIKIIKLVFVRYQHPDPKGISVFLRGMGMIGVNNFLWNANWKGSRLRLFTGQKDRN